MIRCAGVWLNTVVWRLGIDVGTYGVRRKFSLLGYIT